MKLTFLGTGTSTGIPQIGCTCKTCTSADPRDNRLRCSALLTTDAGRQILIDCGPDFRQQMLRAGAPAIEALLVTHIHYDHVGGLDDLRPYSGGRPFPIYCRADVARDLMAHMPYCFGDQYYPGSPKFDMHIVTEGDEVEVCGVRVKILSVMHNRLPILGFRVGDFAYITDAKTLPDSTFDDLRGVKTLVINALRHEPHPSHFSLVETLDAIRRVAPRESYLVHMSHDMGPHATAELTLPEGVHFAYDGLTITI
jgi:phosphoribosyl 1,2-cyclic phosphate phosphodiesterase